LNLRPDRQVHRVHSMIVAKLPRLPILMTAEEFKLLCTDCFVDEPLDSVKMKMAVLVDTAVSKQEIPQLEKEFVRYVSRFVDGGRGNLAKDREYFGEQARSFALDFFEVSRWYYNRFS